MKKMEIKKYKKDFENNYKGLDYPVESDYTVGFTHNRIFIRTLDKNNYLVITLEPKDIRNLMNYWMGQEQHREDKKRHEIKQSPEGLTHYINPDENRKSLEKWRMDQITDKYIENQKIVGILLEDYNRFRDNIIHSMEGDESINLKYFQRAIEETYKRIKEITGKDIQDL